VNIVSIVTLHVKLYAISNSKDVENVEGTDNEAEEAFDKPAQTFFMIINIRGLRVSGYT
jgi:hypothetical protein